MSHNAPPPEFFEMATKLWRDMHRSNDAQSSRTVSEMYDAWLASIQSRERTLTARAHRRFVDKMRVEDGGAGFVLGHLKVQECDLNHLRAWQTQLRKVKSRKTDDVLSTTYRHGVRMSLSSAFVYGVEQGWINLNPVRKLEFEEGYDKKREGYFSTDQLTEFLRHCHPLLADILVTCLRSGGMRNRELRNLRKDQIDHAGRRFVVRNKGGKIKKVPIHDDVYGIILRRAAVAPGDYIFPNPRDPKGGPIPTGTLTRWMHKARDAYGLTLLGEKPVLHHARHGAAVEMLRVGMPDQWVSAVLGHVNTKQLARYGALRGDAEEDARAIMNRIGKTENPEPNSFPCPRCKQPYPDIRDAAECFSRHEAATQATREPPKGVTPIAAFVPPKKHTSP